MTGEMLLALVTLFGAWLSYKYYWKPRAERKAQSKDNTTSKDKTS